MIVTYDFLKNNHRHIQEYRDMNVITNTLDKFGVDIEEEISLKEFIAQLLEEITNHFDIEKYNEIIKLNLDEFYIDSQYLQDNIEGSGINSLYYLSDNYTKIKNILETVSSDQEEEIISNLFGCDFDHLSKTHTVEELVLEIISGCLTIIDLYKEENKINDKNDTLTYIENEIHENTIVSLLSLPEIKEHTWFSKKSTLQCFKYLQLLCFCCDQKNPTSLGFLKQLSAFAGSDYDMESILSEVDERNKLISDERSLLELLPEDEDKYTLITDMLFLSYLSGKDMQNKFIGIIASQTKPNNFKKSISVAI